MDDEIEHTVGDLNHLRKACQIADLVVLEFDGGTLIPKGAALLNDGRDAATKGGKCRDRPKGRRV